MGYSHSRLTCGSGSVTIQSFEITSTRCRIEWPAHFAMTTIRIVQVLFAVWLAATPERLAPGPGNPTPDRAAAAWLARSSLGRVRIVEFEPRVTLLPLTVSWDEAAEEEDSEEDERDDLARMSAAFMFTFGFAVVKPPSPSITSPRPSASPRPLFLLCGCLIC